MPEISLPDVKLPRLQWPDGLRALTADDIAKALPEVKLPEIKRPDIRLPKVALADVDVGTRGKLEVPRIEVRRKRSGPPWKVLALVVGLVAAAWMLFASATTGPRIRSWIHGLRQRIDDLGGTGPRDDRDTEPVDVRALAAQPADLETDAGARDRPAARTGRPRAMTEEIAAESA
jgi:hypothetical protein